MKILHVVFSKNICILYMEKDHTASPLRGFAACVFPAPLVNTRFVWTWVNARYDRAIIIIRTHVKQRIHGASYRYNSRLTPLVARVTIVCMDCKLHAWPSFGHEPHLRN